MSAPFLQYREELPPPELAGWVEAFWLIQTLPTAGEQAEHWVLPEAAVNIVFWAPRGWRQAAAMIPPILSGPTLKEFRKAAVPGEEYLGVRFWPGAGPAFVERSGKTLASVIQPLHQVQPEWSHRLLERLRGADSETGALATVIEELRVRAATQPPADSLMIEAADWYRWQLEPVTLRQWGQRVGLSERQFRRRFVDAVGLSPKAFMRVVRMQAMVRSHLLRPRVNWGQLSYTAGFSDQAHLANEFRSLSGDRPTQFHRHLQAIAHHLLASDSDPHGRKIQDPTEQPE